jgi:NAD(P)-dependent dehydrogenase (short-subunit alcohol dehydrogenase family)
MNATPTKQAGVLSGQVAIVTGGGRGIGRAIALALARAGAQVAVAARSPDQLTETVALIQEQGSQGIACPIDVTNPLAVETMVRTTIRQLGPPDLLVNSAGIAGQEGLLWEVEAEDWWRVLEVNVRGPFLCARAVLPHMLARHRGRIINLASNVGTRPVVDGSAYAVSKAALLRLTDCLAVMVNGHDIAIFAISPGLVHTGMTQGLRMFRDVPESDWTPIERAGELCVYLASGEADRLSGRYLHVLDDVPALVRRADEIEQNDLYALRLRK